MWVNVIVTKDSQAQYCLFIVQDDVSSDESCRSEGTSSDSENEYDRLRRKNIEELAAFREKLGLVCFIPFIFYHGSCIFQPAFSKVDSLLYLNRVVQLTANESSEKDKLLHNR